MTNESNSKFIWCTDCDERPHARWSLERGFYLSCNCSDSNVSNLDDRTMHQQAPRSWEYFGGSLVRRGDDDDMPYIVANIEGWSAEDMEEFKKSWERSEF